MLLVSTMLLAIVTSCALADLQPIGYNLISFRFNDNKTDPAAICNRVGLLFHIVRSDIIIRHIDNTSTNGIFCCFVDVVDFYFSENIPTMGHNCMNAYKTQQGNFFCCFAHGHFFRISRSVMVRTERGDLLSDFLVLSSKIFAHMIANISVAFQHFLQSGSDFSAELSFITTPKNSVLKSTERRKLSAQLI